MQSEPPSLLSPEDQQQEEKHFEKIIRSFLNYRTHTLAVNDIRRNHLSKLPSRHKKWVEKLYSQKLDAVEHRINKNAEFVYNIVSEHLHFNCTDDSEKVSEQDMEKVRSTLRQFVRDWSEEGRNERDQVYLPIVQAIEKIHQDKTAEQKGKVNVLVPGAGLGRLAFDIIEKGYSCQGNEFSFHMLLASNFILNVVTEPRSISIYPWIHTFSNVQSTEQHQLREVTIPDIVPNNPNPDFVEFSMVAGDFIEVYMHPSQQGKWDVIATCFFIDTAHNLMEYLEVIQFALKPGSGRWINHGPLLYHFEGVAGELSIELSMDEIREIMKEMGFVIEDEKIASTTYAANPNTMLKYVYDAWFFVAALTPPPSYL